MLMFISLPKVFDCMGVAGRIVGLVFFILAGFALGYSIFYVEVLLPNGSTGQLLDIMDYISNSFMMPFIAFLSSIFIGWVIKPAWIAEEMEYGGRSFTESSSIMLWCGISCR